MLLVFRIVAWWRFLVYNDSLFLLFCSLLFIFLFNTSLISIQYLLLISFKTIWQINEYFCVYGCVFYLIRFVFAVLVILKYTMLYCLAFFFFVLILCFQNLTMISKFFASPIMLLHTYIRTYTHKNKLFYQLKMLDLFFQFTTTFLYFFFVLLYIFVFVSGF